MAAAEKIKKVKNYLAEETDKVGEIATQYGFTVIKPPHIESDDISKARQFKEFDFYADAEEKVALTRWYIEEKLENNPQPVAIQFKKPLPGGTARKKPGVETYGFEIMGSSKSTSEALLIKCALAVLDDLGYDDVCVDINSIGDRESISRFERELTGYIRKHIGDFPARLRELTKKNHYSVLLDSPETRELSVSLPQTIATLSDLGRIHFKEVLESLEAFEVMYKIKPNMISNKLYAANTIFEIRQTESNDLLCYGYRYALAKKLGARREVPSVGMTIMVKKATKKVLVKNIKKPRYYLCQLGPNAKLKCLNIVEMLRKEKIPVYHSITKDKITGQLSGAEYMHASHVLIMGQKEAIENTIVVRNISNREQETVPIKMLAEFLKKIEKGR